MARITPSDHGHCAGPPVWSPRVEAAFFDLDKTVIAKASMVAFSGPLHRAGLLSRRLLLRAAWGQLVYAQFGASPEKLAKLRDSVLRLTIGWDQAEISDIVRETLVDVVEPIVFDEALELIREHRAAGRKVFIISASPEEIVAPLARYLGVDEAIATRAELDDQGRYTGRTELYCYGPDEGRRRCGRWPSVTASTSPAATATATRPPTCRCWRRSAIAVAVNPDRELLRAAKVNGWEIRRFSQRVPLRERVPMPAPRHAAVGGGAMAATVAVAVTGPVVVGTASAPAPTPTPQRRQDRGGACAEDQDARTFFVAMVASATITTSEQQLLHGGERSGRSTLGGPRPARPAPTGGCRRRCVTAATPSVSHRSRRCRSMKIDSVTAQ